MVLSAHVLLRKAASIMQAAHAVQCLQSCSKAGLMRASCCSASQSAARGDHTCRRILLTTDSRSELTFTRSSLSTMRLSSVPTRSSGMLNLWFSLSGASCLHRHRMQPDGDNSMYACGKGDKTQGAVDALEPLCFNAYVN